ncbi:glycoside hydrolase family 16 protein [Streptomyces spectabilis]|uniref:glycoside hydrolase family 16 protein n=1 Tax=Streptomyces spectabilis TaxID=68270 RepID=UPI0033EC81A0
MPQRERRRGRTPLIAVTFGAALVVALLSAPAEASGASAPSEDACRTTMIVMPRGDCGPFRQVFAEDFEGDSVPLGSFADCDHTPDRRTAYCGGLTGEYRANWWAYPAGWQDTAKSGADGNAGRAVGGVYHPEDTVSVGPADDGDGRMRIRMWRPYSGGDIHSAALVPKRVMEQAYGKFSARIKVTRLAVGYKSAWLHYGGGCEIDYPEQNWTDTITAFHHPCDGRPQGSFPTGARWTDWHTVSTEWTPGRVRFFLDGERVGEDTRGVPSRPLSWILQNESALYGPYAAPGSSAQLEITWITAYAYDGCGDSPAARPSRPPGIREDAAVPFPADVVSRPPRSGP